MDLDKITFDLDKNVLEELYKETPIKDVGSIEDFLKLPVNDKYKNEKESKNQPLDFNIKFTEIIRPKIIIQD